jgi:hypothetical protein
MMRKTAQQVLGLWLLTFAVVCPQLMAQAAKPAKAPVKLKVGDVAPDFKMQYFDGHDLKDVSLGQYRDKKNVVLAFYIFAFTGG